MGRYEDCLEQEARLAKECDYKSPSEADEELRTRYEHNKREVDQADALGEEAGPMHIMYMRDVAVQCGSGLSCVIRICVRDQMRDAGARWGCSRQSPHSCPRPSK